MIGCRTKTAAATRYYDFLIASLSADRSARQKCRLYFNKYVFSLPIATCFGDPHSVTLDEKPFTLKDMGNTSISKGKGCISLYRDVWTLY